MERNFDDSRVQGRRSGTKKDEVRVEVEDGRVLQITGERKSEQEEKTDTGTVLKEAAADSLQGSSCQRMPGWIRSRLVCRMGFLLLRCPKMHPRRPMLGPFRFLIRPLCFFVT